MTRRGAIKRLTRARAVEAALHDAVSASLEGALVTVQFC